MEVVVALIGFAGVIGTALIKLLSDTKRMREENSQQHAAGRELIIEHGAKLGHFTRTERRERRSDRPRGHAEEVHHFSAAGSCPDMKLFKVIGHTA